MTMKHERKFTFVEDLENIRKKPVWYTGKCRMEELTEE